MPEQKVLIDVKKLESLLPRMRILDSADLDQFASFAFRLWELSRGLPEDFRMKIFVLQDFFQHYIAYNPGPYRPTREEAINHLNSLLPKRE